MISSAIIPQPLARLPWRLIFLIAGIAGIGIITLYSAAGGSAQPWATKQAIVILFFLAIAITMSWTSETTIKKVAFPLYERALEHGIKGVRLTAVAKTIDGRYSRLVGYIPAFAKAPDPPAPPSDDDERGRGKGK